MKKLFSMLLTVLMTMLIAGSIQVFAMPTAELDNGLAKGIEFFNKGMYYEARDEFQWFWDANQNNLDAGQKEYVEGWLNGAKEQVAELEARHIVLMLDNTNQIGFTSGGRTVYTAGTAVNYVKDSAKQFVKNIFSSSNKQYVAIVSFSSEPKVLCNFTNDENVLLNAISGMKTGDKNNTNTAAALQTTDSLFANKYTAGDKHLVIFTTGHTYTGEYLTTGKYDETVIGNTWRNPKTKVKIYQYANKAHQVADKIKGYAKIYTIGVFQTMENATGSVRNIAEFYKMNTRDLATSPDYFYPVDNADALSEIFKIVAEDIQINPSIWAKGEIKEAKDSGLIPDVLMDQDLSKTVTRGEFAAISVQLYEALTGKTVGNVPNAPFKDIANTENRDAINKAYSLNIIQGVSNDAFLPNAKISRQDLATMLCRTVKKYKFEDWTLDTDSDYYLDSEGVKKYADDADISAYAKPSVYYLTKMDIVKGVDGNKFAPLNTSSEQEASDYANATREQAIVLALRIFKLPNLK